MRARAWVQFGYCAAGAGLGPKDTPRSPPLHGGVPLKVSSKDAAVTTFTVPRGRHMSTRWAVGATRQTGPGMATFTGKPTATAQKLRGGYYTPEPLARLLGAWGAAAGPRLLEPSCGDGAILRCLPASASVTGVEIEAGEAAAAGRGAPAATIVQADFFDWFGPDQHAQWDGVVGNPPFIRFHHWTE